MSKKTILAAGTAVLCVAGTFLYCGGNRSAKAVGMYEALAVRACECKTTDCAKKTLISFKTITMEYKDVKFDNIQKLRMAEAGQKFVDCIMKNGVNINDFKELEKDLKENDR